MSGDNNNRLFRKLGDRPVVICLKSGGEPILGLIVDCEGAFLQVMGDDEHGWIFRSDAIDTLSYGPPEALARSLAEPKSKPKKAGKKAPKPEENSSTVLDVPVTTTSSTPSDKPQRELCDMCGQNWDGYVIEDEADRKMYLGDISHEFELCSTCYCKCRGITPDDLAREKA